MKPFLPLTLLFLLPLLLWLSLRWFEKVNLYIPDKELTAHPGTWGLRYEEALIETEDGVRLHAWLVRATSAPARGTVLVFHGNAGNVSNRLEKAALLCARGFDVLLFDYRGYGRSGGSPDEQGTYRDGRAAARWLAARGVFPERTAYYGESLGCAVALQTALDLPPAALVLDSAFTSVPEMARLVFPGLPLHRAVRYRYDNLAKIPSLRRPLLVVHSPQDEIVPYAMGERLFAAAPNPKRFLRTAGSHNEGFQTYAGWADELAGFLREHLSEDR